MSCSQLNTVSVIHPTVLQGVYEWYTTILLLLEEEKENSNNNSFHKKIVLKFKEESNEVLQLDYSFIWCWSLHTSESRWEIPGKFQNAVLENDGENHTNRVRNEDMLKKVKVERSNPQTIKIRKT